MLALEERATAGARAEAGIQRTADDVVSALTEIDATNGTDQQPDYDRQQIVERLRLARGIAA